MMCVEHVAVCCSRTNCIKFCALKGFTPKWKFCHNLLSRLICSKPVWEDILKNVGNQTVDGNIFFLVCQPKNSGVDYVNVGYLCCFKKMICKSALEIQSSGMKIWCSPIDLTQYDIIRSSHVTADWFSSVLVANELAAQHSSTCKCLLYSSSTLQKPSTFPSSTCIDLLQGVASCMLWGLFIGYMLYVQQQYFSHAHSSVLWMYWQ